jgi:hypothetical protein
VAALTIALAACAPGAQTPPAAEASVPAPAAPIATAGSAAVIRTDRDTYHLRPMGVAGEPGFTLVTTYHNRSTEPFYLSGCSKIPPRWRLEKQVSGAWVHAYELECALIAAETPPRIAPGDARVDTLRVVDYTPAWPRFKVHPIAGTYRLVYYGVTPPQARETGMAPPQILRYSNEFRIEE